MQVWLFSDNRRAWVVTVHWVAKSQAQRVTEQQMVPQTIEYVWLFWLSASVCHVIKKLALEYKLHFHHQRHCYVWLSFIKGDCTDVGEGLITTDRVPPLIVDWKQHFSRQITLSRAGWYSVNWAFVQLNMATENAYWKVLMIYLV